jgi:hypothetical protein
MAPTEQLRRNIAASPFGLTLPRPFFGRDLLTSGICGSSAVGSLRLSAISDAVSFCFSSQLISISENVQRSTRAPYYSKATGPLQLVITANEISTTDSCE